MNFWTPTPIWSDREVYVVGGGTSLDRFPWEVLRGKPTIACNAAFLLGVGVCPVTIFGDGKFLTKFETGLSQYAAQGGIVATTSRIRWDDPPAWLLRLRKTYQGLAKNAIAWNGNTGAAAINLALILGARTVYLLGFDMKANSDGRTHFHSAYARKTEQESFQRFVRGMKSLNRDLHTVFPGRSIINLTEDSALNVFPKNSLNQHLDKLRSPRLKEVS